MVNGNKGWMRLVEAFIAITIIAGFLIIMWSANIDIPNRTNEIYDKANAILDEVAENAAFRADILEEDKQNIINFVSRRIPKGFEFDIKICPYDQICSLENFKPKIYSVERIVSANLTKYDPKKIKIFLWPK